MSKIITLGNIPQEHKSETSQFKRVLPLLESYIINHCKWGIILLDYAYFHNKLHDNETSYHGQSDILLFTEHCFTMYELKSMNGSLISGCTDLNDWIIHDQYGKPVYQKPVFQRKSRLRRHFLQDVCNQYDKIKHFRVKNRIVFPTGFDYRSFKHLVTRKWTPQSFEQDVLDKITCMDDQLFLKSCYFYNNQDNMFHRKAGNKYKQMEKIFSRYNIQIRTKKWFSVITEDHIVSDCITNPADDFTISFENAYSIANQMLIKSDKLKATGPDWYIKSNLDGTVIVTPV